MVSVSLLVAEFKFPCGRLCVYGIILLCLLVCKLCTLLLQRLQLLIVDQYGPILLNVIEISKAFYFLTVFHEKARVISIQIQIYLLLKL